MSPAELITVLLLCGPPASGKSSVAQQLATDVQRTNCQGEDCSCCCCPMEEDVLILELDDLLHEVGHSDQHTNVEEGQSGGTDGSLATNEFDPRSWHVASERLFSLAREWLHKQIELRNDTKADVATLCEDSTSMSRRPRRRHCLLLVVDNFPLRSMRLRYRRLVTELHGSLTSSLSSSLQSITLRYSEVFFLANEECCVRRNAGRVGTAAVPEHVVRSLASTFETPLSNRRCSTRQEQAQLVCLLQQSPHDSTSTQRQQQASSSSSSENLDVLSPPLWVGTGKNASVVEALPNRMLLHIELAMQDTHLWKRTVDCLAQVVVMDVPFSCLPTSPLQFGSHYLSVEHALKKEANVVLTAQQQKTSLLSIEEAARKWISRVVSIAAQSSKHINTSKRNHSAEMDQREDVIERFVEQRSAVCGSSSSSLAILGKDCVQAKKKLLCLARENSMQFLRRAHTDEEESWVLDDDAVLVVLLELLQREREA